MEIQTWQVIVAAAIPIFAFLGAIVSRAERTPALYRKLRHSTSALKDLPADADDARAALERIVVQQADQIFERETRRRDLRQRLDWKPVSLAILWTVATPVVVWGLLVWIGATWGTPWAWLSVPLSGIAVLFLLIWDFEWWGYALIPRQLREQLHDLVARGVSPRA